MNHHEMETEQKFLPRGRPRQRRWEDRVKEDIRMLGVMNGEELAEHRES